MAFVTEKGTIRVLNAEQSGTAKSGNTWISREFVIEVREDRFINDLHFKAFGRECEDLREARVGDEITVSYKPSSREYNGRWYDELKLFSVSVEKREPAPSEPTETKPEDPKDDLPF